jgi:aldehyde dehydrogenase (NAD+)
MYTGSGNVAKIVMQAAAKHLTPVTLELGGKSPVYFDHSALNSVCIERLVWGKWLNAGQTCVAPDYVLATQETASQLIPLLQKQISAMYGNDPKQSDSYGRIVNNRHLTRLNHYLDGQNVVIGGECDNEQNYLAPTVVLAPDIDSPIMQDELFGPILPIVIVADINAAMALVKSRAKPLAAYIFSKNTAQQKQWQQKVSAGSMAINDTFMFTTVADLPFGGVGASGMGCHSGKHGFDNFSHTKSVIKRPLLKDLPIRFAPFNKLKLKLVKMVR